LTYCFSFKTLPERPALYHETATFQHTGKRALDSMSPLGFPEFSSGCVQISTARCESRRPAFLPTIHHRPVSPSTHESRRLLTGSSLNGARPIRQPAQVVYSMPRPIQAVIHQPALANNLEVVRRQAPASRIWAVVKANAYGHGIRRVFAGLKAADGLACSISEAVLLRDLGWQGPILLLEGIFQAQDAAARAIPPDHRRALRGAVADA
jgi:hypothetical protein